MWEVEKRSREVVVGREREREEEGRSGGEARDDGRRRTTRALATANGQHSTPTAGLGWERSSGKIYPRRSRHGRQQRGRLILDSAGPRQAGVAVVRGGDG